MSQSAGSSAGRLLALGLTTALVLVLSGSVALAAVATTVPTPTTPAPSVTFVPRVRSFPPRVVSFTPRVRDVAPTRHANVYTVGSDVLFAFDRSELSVSARTVLAGIVAHLRVHRTGTITVSGYTDSIGTQRYNLGLSRRRAGSVQSYLAHALPSGLHYVIRGDGESHPVASNATGPGRQQNRRVTVSYAAGA